MTRTRPAAWPIQFLLAVFLAAPFAGAVADDSARHATAGFSLERLERLQPTLQRYVDQGEVAGIVALVMHDGEVIHRSAVGSADKEARKPMREDTLFRIASQTKALTSVAILQLMEQGKLSIAQPASAFIPSFAETTVAVTTGETTQIVPAKRPITIRDLLTHTAGISYGREASIADRYAAQGLGPAAGNGWYFADKDEAMCEVMERLGKLPFVAQPGEAFVYGYSTDVLGCIVERVSGQTLEQYFKANITDPLGMTDTFFYVPASKRARLAAVYASVDGRAVRAPDGPAGQGHYADGPRRAFSGGAGLVSTAHDYARFLEALRRGGELDGQRILAPRSVALMRTNQIGELHSADGLGYGYGFQTTERFGAMGLETPGSYGWSGAYGSFYRVDPKEGLTTVFMIQQTPNRTDVRARFSAVLYQALVEPEVEL